jgi:spermidine/putrescine transport system substrate-binding protein
MRSLLALLILLIGVLPVVAQDDASDEAEAIEPVIEWVCPEGFEGQTLNIWNWALYIGDSTVTTFEELCGVTVVYDVYDSNEALMARLRQGNPGYDIAFPGEYAIANLVRDGLLQKIDTASIPNYENIDEIWRGLYFDPDEEYSVPYLWGTFGPAYNTNKVDEIVSWNDVWDHSGAVVWVDDPRSIIGIGLLMLGYDPNSTEADEIAEAAEYILEKSRNVVAFAGEDGQTQLARGDADIALEYSGDVYQVIEDCECEDFAYVLPEEGSFADVAGMVLLEGAPNPELALVFMDYILDPAVSAIIVKDVLYPTTNRAAVESGFIPEDILNNPLIFPSEEVQERLFLVQDVGEAQQYYNDAWDEILIFAGN